MIGNFISIPQEAVDRAEAQIQRWHLETHDGEPTSLVWALAHEAIAQRIRAQLAQQQINISGIDLEIHPNAAGN